MDKGEVPRIYFVDNSINQAVECCLENTWLYCLRICKPEEFYAVFLSKLALSRTNNRSLALAPAIFPSTLISKSGSHHPTSTMPPPLTVGFAYESKLQPGHWASPLP